MPILPNGSISTSSVGVGCAYLTDGSFTRKEDRIIHAALDAGARHFDVAPQYGLGTAENVLGRALSKHRSSVTITSKVGIKRLHVSRKKLYVRAMLEPVRAPLRHVIRQTTSTISEKKRLLEFSSAYVNDSLSDSLHRLKTDYLDVYLLHMVSKDDITDELLTALTKRREAGDILTFGLATDRVETDKILANFPSIFDVVQYSWSMLDLPLDIAENAPLLISHRAISRAFTPLQSWLTKDHEACKRLSSAIDIDLANAKHLAGVLLGASISVNPNGLGLVASRHVERTRANVRSALDPKNQRAGKALFFALRQEKNIPAPVI